MDNSCKPPTNGVGPNWFPIQINKVLTKYFEKIYEPSVWYTHDIQYEEGIDEADRLRSDYIFLKNMLAALTYKSIKYKLIGIPLAYIFFILVVIFGPLSFNYGGKPRC